MIYVQFSVGTNSDKGLNYLNSNYIRDGEHIIHVTFKGLGFRVE